MAKVATGSTDGRAASRTVQDIVNVADENSQSAPGGTLPSPPGSWAPARQLVRHMLAPVERFLAIEAASGVLLLLVAVVALVWANSPWRLSYDRLWHTAFGFRFGPWLFERNLHFWINDGLMTIFFFVVGLEIRREIHGGELSELRHAALPLVDPGWLPEWRGGGTRAFRSPSSQYAGRP